MRTTFLLFLFVISSTGFAQNNMVLKTDDGKRVLLKADYTWEYIDRENPDNKRCDLPDDFVEPKLDQKIQAQLKKGRATIDDVKRKVAKDYNCDISDVILLSFTEQKVKAVYHFCANGTKVTYKRTGFSIIKGINLF